MKKFIELTSLDGRKLYINIDHIGDFSEIEEITFSYGSNSKKWTNVGVTTHNNGGFRVQESAQEILNLINN